MATLEENKELDIIIYFLGTRGDIMPGVPIAKALQKRGHRVVFASTPNYRESVEAYGVPFEGCGNINWEWRNEYSYLTDEEVDEYLVTHDTKRFQEIIGDKGLPWNLHHISPVAAKDLVKITNARHFDVIFANVCSSFTAVRLARAQNAANKDRQMVYIGTNYSPGFMTASGGSVPAGYELSRFRWINWLKHYHFAFMKFLPLVTGMKDGKIAEEELSKVEGIEATPMTTMVFDMKKKPLLALWSPSLFPPEPDYPANLKVVGLPLVPSPPTWKPSPALEAFMNKKDAQGRSPVVVGFGSMPGGQKLEEQLAKMLSSDLGFNVVLQPCSKEPVRTDFGVLNGGAGQLDAGASNVFRIGYVPHDWLLPRSCAAFCHGGAGTVQRCLWTGTPIIISPMVAVLLCDQYWHGYYIERLGYGALLSTLKPTLEQVKGAIERALQCKQTCMELSRKMQDEPDGAESVANEIERIVDKEHEAKDEVKKGCFGR